MTPKRLARIVKLRRAMHRQAGAALAHLDRELRDLERSAEALMTVSREQLGESGTGLDIAPLLTQLETSRRSALAKRGSLLEGERVARQALKQVELLVEKAQARAKTRQQRWDQLRLDAWAQRRSWETP